MRTLRTVVALLGLGGLVLGVQAVPAAAEAPKFGVEAKAAGLSTQQARELQGRVDGLLARDGGTQIAANRVRWADGRGDTTLPLPGERNGRTLKATAAGTCDYGNMCLFQIRDYGGERYSLYYCQDYSTSYSFNSWINNQTGHTVAVFKNINRAEIGRTPGAYSSTAAYSGLYTYFVKPC